MSTPPPSRESVQDFLEAALRAIKEKVRREAARDVCTYCSRHTLGYLAAQPANNGSGNWIHRPTDGPLDGMKLCVATGIYNRMAFEAAS